jgi:N-acylneuraminate cytidylyltransferase
LAVIPARGGSKRIPRKNVKSFCGKPMISWSIEAAQKSRLFHHIVVSTDDQEIAAVATEYGAEVPFMRPARLSDDFTGTTEVVAHAVRWALDQGWAVEAVCCIYATAPFIRVEDLQHGLEVLESGKWSYAFTATDFPASIFRSFKRHSAGGVEMFFPEHFDTRSQDLPVAYHDAAQFYWGRPSAWLAEERIFAPHSYPIVIPRWRVQDIDTEEDWQRAQLLAPVINPDQKREE